MKVDGKDYRTVWLEGSTVKTIEQRLLPHRFEIAGLATHRDTAEAIRGMLVRGAGAIGAAAGYGMAQVFLEAPQDEPARSRYVAAGYETLRTTRPTARDLFYAIDRVLAAGKAAPSGQSAAAAVREAQAVADENAQAGEMIGRHGAPLIRPGFRVLTHCNAGWLAFVDWGSALSPIYFAHRAGVKLSVWVDETRPRCQGASLTAWELLQEGVPFEIIADNAAGFLMSRGEVDLVITGADRIAANGDAANKIGTYEKALCAKAHNIPFYVAAPLSTFDRNCPSGRDIPIERRDEDEVLYAAGITEDGRMARVRLAPEHARACNYAFDVTPAELIAGLITQRGIIPPTREAIARVLGNSSALSGIK
jgi:methylthioribose-1-phosphate isomerase